VIYSISAIKYADMLYVSHCIVNRKLAYMNGNMHKGQCNGDGCKGKGMGRPRKAVP